MKSIITGILAVVFVMGLAAVTVAEDKHGDEAAQPAVERVHGTDAPAADEPAKADEAVAAENAQEEDNPAAEQAAAEAEKPAEK